MTVLGPVPVQDLGITLAHEHLLIDLSCVWTPPAFPWQEPLVDALPSAENRALLDRDPYVSRPNLLLDEPELAVQELSSFREQGGRSVVDLTVEGIAPRPEALAKISRRSGVQVAAGCGWYTRRAHPTGVAASSVEALAETLIRQFEEGFGETGIRPGIIGELGTSSPIHPDEVKVLQAGAVAQRATGLAVNVHVAIFAREAVNALKVLEAAGADISRVVISHLDEQPDVGYHLSVLERGAYVEFDTFGSEFAFESSGQREPRDEERLDVLLRLLDAGWTERLLLAQDVCTKVQLMHYGGKGYGHILKTIVPRLEQVGVDKATIETLLVRNPARLLDLDDRPTLT